MFLRCRIADKEFPNATGDFVLNTDHVIWMAPHPEQRDMTLVRLTHGEALCILAPFEDVVQEIEHVEADKG